MGVGTPFKLSVETSVGASQRADDSPALRAPDWEGSGCGGKWLSGYLERLDRGIFTMTSTVGFKNC